MSPYRNSAGRRLSTTVILPLACSGLWGCASVEEGADRLRFLKKAEEPDASVPHALMRVSTSHLVTLTPATHCTAPFQQSKGMVVNNALPPLAGIGLNGQLRGVAGDAPPRLKSAELRVAAGVPHVLAYSFLFNAKGGVYNCEGASRFVPVEGMHYQATTVGDAATARCGIQLTQLLPLPVPVPTAAALPCPR